MRNSSLGIPSALVAAFLACCEGSLAERPRHVILVTVEAVRAGDPAGFLVDDAAAKGTRFARAFAPCAEEAMHGRSLVHVLRGGLADPRPAFGVGRDGTTTVRDERRRLVWNPGRVEPPDARYGSSSMPGIALFDASADLGGPGGTNDLASSHPGVVVELQAAITKWPAGLEPCARSRTAPTPERIQALREMGYLEKDR